MNKLALGIGFVVLLTVVGVGCMIVANPPENQQQPASTQTAQPASTPAATATQTATPASTPAPLKVKMPKMGGGAATDAGANQ